MKCKTISSRIALAFILIGGFRSVSAIPFPAASGECADGTLGTKSISITSVNIGNGSATVNIKSNGSGLNPEHVVILLSSAVNPNLEYLANVGKTGLNENRSGFGKVNSNGTASVTFANLDPTVGYSVYAMGYRCNLQQPGSGYRTKWIPHMVNGERVIHIPNGGDCRDGRPFIDRVDLSSNDNSRILGALFFIRARACNSAGNINPFADGKITAYSSAGPYDVGGEIVLSRLTWTDFASLQSKIFEEISAPLVTPSYWTWKINPPQHKWIGSYIFLPGDVPELTFQFKIAGDAKNRSYSLQASPNSKTWINNVSKKVGGILQSQKSAAKPLAVPSETNEGLRWRILSAMSLQQFALSSLEGSDVAAYFDSWWETAKDLDPEQRLSELSWGGASYLPKRLAEGFYGGLIPEITMLDQSVSPYGWSRLGGNLTEGLTRTQSLGFEITENVDLFVRQANGTFDCINCNGSVSSDGLQYFTLHLAGVASSSSQSTIYELINGSGIWIRANKKFNSSGRGEELEKFLVKSCNGEVTCRTVRGSVVRRAFLNEGSQNTQQGIRRNNVAEMLPGETRGFNFGTDLVFPTGQRSRDISFSGCRLNPSMCYFSARFPENSVNSFEISASADAIASQDSMMIDLRQIDGTIFVADVAARIFGRTQLIIVGGATNPEADADLSIYRRAADVYRAYIRQYGNPTTNVRVVNCAEGRNGAEEIICSSDLLNSVISSYSNQFAHQLDGVTYFGHGSLDGYPILRNGVPWSPQPSRASFSDNAVFTSFGCNGGREGGLSAFIGAWGVTMIGNRNYTGLSGFTPGINGIWESEFSRNAIDVVMYSTDKPQDQARRRPLLIDGTRRGLITPVPNAFIMATGATDPNTGDVLITDVPYELDAFPIFKIGSKFNFPVLP